LRKNIGFFCCPLTSSKTLSPIFKKWITKKTIFAKNYQNVVFLIYNDVYRKTRDLRAKEKLNG